MTPVQIVTDACGSPLFKVRKAPPRSFRAPEVVQIEVQRKIHLLDVIFSDFERNFI